MSELASGVRLGSYELIRMIGHTRMSDVWQAQDREGRTVALKTISSRAGDDSQLRARFLREGGEHQLLKMASIVPILDFFELSGSFYLVMQYISGGSLEDLLERQPGKPLPIAEALNVARQILPALDYAHQNGVIHRDVKPSNILLEDNRAYLTDFGIALALGRPRLTTVAQVMGTQCYMSPEQIATPLSVTHLTDVYSFGCVLYEMLTGRQPYQPAPGSKETQYALLAKRMREPPASPRQSNPEVSVRLERVVLTSLAAEPKDRFPGCGSFVRALEGIENEKSPSPPGERLESTPVLRAPSEPLGVWPDPPAVPAAKQVSVSGNMMAAVFAGLFWIPFARQDADTLVAVRTASILLSNILLLRMLYMAWAALPVSLARTSPGKAVGYLFIPFYNLFWCWKVFPGFASDYNRYAMQAASGEKPKPETFYKLFCIVHVYLTSVAAVLSPNSLVNWVVLFDFMIMIPIMIGVLANAVNGLAAISGRQLMKPGGEEQGIR